MRNYLQGAGFFLVSALAFVGVISIVSVSDKTISQPIFMTLAVSLLLVGILLVILQKRDLPAIIFMLTGMSYIFYAAINLSFDYHTLISLVLACVVITSKDKSKYLYTLLLVTYGVMGIFASNLSLSSPVSLTLLSIYGLIALYYAFACMSEKIELPLHNLLTTDNQTDFKASGSVLGYLLFSLSASVWAGVYFFGLSAEAATVLDSICGLMLILSGILLYAVAKMRFTPVMFILLGCLLYLGQFAEGMITCMLGAMFIILGLFAVLRKESRILPALMLIIYGLTHFISVFITGVAFLPILSGVLNLIPAIIAVYLAFAVFSQRNLPLL